MGIYVCGCSECTRLQSRQTALPEKPLQMRGLQKQGGGERASPLPGHCSVITERKDNVFLCGNQHPYIAGA